MQTNANRMQGILSIKVNRVKGKMPSEMYQMTEAHEGLDFMGLHMK